jgi:hypothetical protein
MRHLPNNSTVDLSVDGSNLTIEAVISGCNVKRAVLKIDNSANEEDHRHAPFTLTHDHGGWLDASPELATIGKRTITVTLIDSSDNPFAIATLTVWTVP